jgi:hypothetical protein
MARLGWRSHRLTGGWRHRRLAIDDQSLLCCKRYLVNLKDLKEPRAVRSPFELLIMLVLHWLSPNINRVAAMTPH